MTILESRTISDTEAISGREATPPRHQVFLRLWSRSLQPRRTNVNLGFSRILPRRLKKRLNFEMVLVGTRTSVTRSDGEEGTIFRRYL